MYVSENKSDNWSHIKEQAVASEDTAWGLNKHTENYICRNGESNDHIQQKKVKSFIKVAEKASEGSTVLLLNCR